MHILAINGSHRGDKGWTRFLIDRLLSGALAAGATGEVVTLSRLKINHCLSCYHCQNEEPHLQCLYHERDDAAMIFEKMAKADMLVFATPVYLMNMSGLFKTFLDRLYSTMNIQDMSLTASGLLHHHVNPAISSKPFVTLVACSNLEDESYRSVTAYFRTYARFMDARQAGVLVRNATPLLDYDREHPGQTAFPRVAEVYRAYGQAGGELARQGFISPSTQRRANQELIAFPFFRVLKHLRPIKRIVIARSGNVLV